MTEDRVDLHNADLRNLTTAPEDLCPIGKRYLEVALNSDRSWDDRILAARKLWYLEGDGRLFTKLKAELFKIES